ncbi:hypothetical protein [Actinophytocola algeriensis]|uniref:Guanylate cyclase domain-containing protein n=1 Tax=Actinophytocola algeriensis TaxID=1768010 RepID=A0A7W7VHL1_9PSEU|nr:hypothetical protein [Actinophytocola algeriensis]MBB4910170.1 hypothetical protein [Actinophytocola algeriensis]MBE1480842.1 hypothetical protein [Actinophytocola algeriensis]
MPREPADPTAPYPPARGRRVRTDRLGFAVDVVSYGRRTEQAQVHLGARLHALLRQVVTDLGDAVDEVDHDSDSGTGDGTVVCLPAHGDPAGLLPAVLRSAATRLAADNAAHGDRIRLRMVVGSGRADRLTCPLVINISRLVDSEPLRRAAATNLDADLVVLVLDTANGDFAPGYLPVAADQVPLVDLTMKESPRRAWLWVSLPQGR